MQTTGHIAHHAGSRVPEPSVSRLVVEPLDLLDVVPVHGPPAILIAVLAAPFLLLRRLPRRAAS